MAQVTIDQVLALLQPTTPWDFILYIILLFLIITMFMQPEGSLILTILLAGAIVAVFMDKVHAFEPRHECQFPTMLIRIAMFLVPLLAAGITKKGNSRGPAVIAAVLALGYTFFLWAMEMNNPAVCPQFDVVPGVLLMPFGWFF